MSGRGGKRGKSAKGKDGGKHSRVEASRSTSGRRNPPMVKNPPPSRPPPRMSKPPPVQAVEPEFDLEAFGGQEVERLMDERAGEVEAAVVALHASLTDLNFWKNDVTASSALPTNVLTRLTVISSQMLRTKAQLLDAFEEMVATSRSLAPRAMVAEIQQQRAATQRAKDESRKNYLEAQDHKQRSELYDKQLVALRWYSMYSRLRAKKQRVRHAKNLGGLQAKIRDLEQRLAMHNVRRLAMAARAEATEHAGGEMEGGGEAGERDMKKLQANISSALGALKAKAKRGEVSEIELQHLNSGVGPGITSPGRMSKNMAGAQSARAGSVLGLYGGMKPQPPQLQAPPHARGSAADGKPHTPLPPGQFQPISFVLPSIGDGGGAGSVTARGVAGEKGAQKGGAGDGGDPPHGGIPEPLALPVKDQYSRSELLEVRLQHTKQLHALQGAFEERLQNVTEFYKYKLQVVKAHVANKRDLPFTPSSPTRPQHSNRRGLHSRGSPQRVGTADSYGSTGSDSEDALRRRQLRIHSHRFLYPALPGSYKAGVDHVNELEMLTAGLPMEMEVQPQFRSQLQPTIPPPRPSEEPSFAPGWSRDTDLAAGEGESEG